MCAAANMKFGFSVMHTAQKKERKAAEATIPHSVFGELKQKCDPQQHVITHLLLMVQDQSGSDNHEIECDWW